MNRTIIQLIAALSFLFPALSVAQGQALLHGGGTGTTSSDGGYTATPGQGSSAEGMSGGPEGNAVSTAKGLHRQGTIYRYDDLLVVAADRDYVISGATVLVDVEGRPVSRQDLYRGQGAMVTAATATGDASRPVALEVIVDDKMSDVE